MSLCGRCSELVYAFTDLVNGMSERSHPAFRGSELPGIFICVGFVTHEYRRLALTQDFGQNYWQHSKQVHNGARNHFWLEFPQPGAEPGDQGHRMILDLSAAQFDMRTPRSLALVIRGQDPRYRKCYELPCTTAPLHFLNWAGERNNTNFDAKHCTETVARFQKKCALPRPSPSCSDAHATLKSILMNSGDLRAGTLTPLAMESPEVHRMEKACGITLMDLGKMEASAAMTMRRELGEGPRPEIGGVGGGCDQQ
eukprot:UN0931